MTNEQISTDSSRVLVVEDKGLIALRIEQLLTGLGYEVTGTVSSGEEALQSVEEQPPDLVLMDIKLAGEMDGVETAARIRAQRDVPIVYLSAYPERMVMEEIRPTRPYGFLVKPVRGQELGATVEMALYKHRMETRLRESEKKYRLLAENVEDVIWQMNETLDRYTYVSPSITRLLGYTPEEMMAMPVGAHLAPASRSRVQEAIDRRLAAEKGGRGDDDKRVWEVEYVRQDGSTVLVESRTRPLRDEDGTFRGLVGVTRDVSKCKRMENALHQQKAFFETLLETIPSPVFYKDMDGRYTGCNRAFEAFIGRDRHEIIGQSVYDMGPSDIADKYAEKDQELFREPGQQRYEWKVKGAEGQMHDVIFDKASIIGSQGQPEGLIGIITDITERKRAEEALRERVKELTCLYAVSRDVQKDLSTAELCQRTVKHLVPAMQFPEITVPVIELDGKRFTPDNYTQEFSHHLHAEIVAQGEVCGHLWVYYAEERPFLIPEEQDLINGVADTLSTWLERKRARDQISFQAHLLNAVEQAVIVTNMDGLVVYWNPFAEQLYGWSAKEAIGRSTLDLIATEQSRQYGAEIMARLQAGESWAGEYQARCRDGTSLPIRATITPVQDAQGELTHAIGISHDITERKRAEQALRESELRLRAIGDNLPAGQIYQLRIETDGTARFTYVSAAVERLHECTVEEALNDPSVLFDRVVEEDIPGWTSATEKAIQEMSLYDHTLRIRRKSGEIRWHRMISKPRMAEDGAILFDGIDMDITEQKRAEEALQESEERYRIVSRLVSDYAYAFRVEPDGTLMGEWVTEAFYDITGYRPEELPTGESWATIFYPEDQAEIRSYITALLEGEAGELEYRIVTKAGEVRWVRTHDRPVWDEGKGRVVRIIGAVQDITERKRFEEALRESEARYRLLFEMTNDIIFIHPFATETQPASFTQVNDVACQVLGYAREELLQLSPLDIVTDRDLQAVPEEAEKLISKGHLLFEKALVTRTDEQIPVEIHARLFELDGRPTVLSIARDVTERKRIEEAIARERERLDTILSTLNTGLSLINPDMTIAWANRKIRQMFPEGEPVGQVCYVFYESVDMPCEGCGTVKTFKTGEPQMCERFNPANERWYSIISQPVKDDQGNVTSVLEGITDVTERKQAEQALQESEKRYRDLVENQGEGIGFVDREEQFAFANPAAHQIFGVPPGTLVGQSLASFLDQEGVAILREQAERRRSGQADDYEIDIIRPDGQRRHLLVTAKPRHEGQQFVGTFGIFRDITERKQALEELQRIEWMLSKSIEPAEPPAEMYQPAYGDVTALNTHPIIMDAVGKSTLKQIAQNAIDLLDTSVAVYEKNGDYAYGLFSSAWCQFMDQAAYKLCGDVDLRTALTCGKWLCHENCWNESAKAAIQSGHATDIECIGGIHLYAVPIFAGQDVIGAINIGYGNPPSDEASFTALAERFQVSVAELQAQAKTYEPRPPYVVALAKKRLHTIATLIGEIVERKQAEDALHQYAERLQTLHEIDAAILAAQSPQEIAQAALLHLRDLVPCQRASVSEIDRRRQRGRDLVVLTGQDVSVKTSAWYPLSGGGALIQALQAGDAHGVEDIAALETLSPLEQMLEPRGLRSYVSVPLLAQGISLGSLNLASDTPGFFQPDHVEILEEIAASLAVAMQQADLLAQTQRDAETKALLLRDVNHRVMNNLDMILSILDLEMEQPRRDEREKAVLQAVLQDVSDRVQGIVTVHRMLSSARRDSLKVGAVTARTIRAVLRGSPIQDQVAVTVNAPEDLPRVSSRQAVALALVINELTTNSIKYAFADRSRGEIRVRIEGMEARDGEQRVRLVFQDDGPGWSEDVLAGERHGIGLWLVQGSVTHTLRGEISWHNEGGAAVEIQFPLCPAA